ncbi:mitochondrial carrier [Punctularia strigosozonata HHB-11173 SS5]|uniref:mitochondrial carrier n=1 Tax=Punctularia strigosozonata (strain HHB-11173) TaxID=741275 RepID=UPI000441764F|nr:mitochondrial carrier [Punctularia strigosozonata HHB-11173 SS5]EIN10161.1 mitochondrial carrier [Punctularia strigosozonata HHB-11173 SS5]
MSNVGQQLLSGAASGFASTVALQPFDFLKTRVQQTDGTLKSKAVKSPLKITRQVIAENGILELWRGTNATLIRNVPGVAIYMSGLTQIRTFMASSPYFASVQKLRSGSSSPAHSHASVLPSLTSGGNLIAGAVTRVSVGFVLNPFSVLKARYESNMYAYTSLSGALVSIVRGGPRELFRGFLASALRDAPYAGLFVVFYEGIKRETSYLLPPTSSVLSTSVHSISAASAGAIATILTHPFDVIKTKIQVRQEDRYQGLWTTTKTIWTQRGVFGFLDGAALRLSRKVLSSAIGWAVYEGILLFQVRMVHAKEVYGKSAG